MIRVDASQCVRRRFVTCLITVATSVPFGVSAVLTSGGMTLVVVKDEAGKARTRVVTTGAASAGKVEILSGLAGGETVLVGLAAAPADGSPVSETKGTAR